MHSNKSQNYRIRSIRQIEAGENRILIATDVMARRLDFENKSHVINVDIPNKRSKNDEDAPGGS
ncbi:helicase-related protein [Planktosalinus lacus]|uniref:helicase-related protein n=1 Tax=Planktosalinus lacus TaxID=1526573 RepID=UPI0035711E9A